MRVAARTTGAWPTANKAILIPFRLNTFERIVSLSILNGGTVSGNWDGGIYNSDGVRIVSSGSTAQSGANATQNFTLTSTLLAPGHYYAAFAANNTTGTLGYYATGLGALVLRCLGLKEVTSSFPLPATLTPAAISSDLYPAFFFSATDRPTWTVGLGRDAEMVPLDNVHSLGWDSVGYSVGARNLSLSSATDAGWFGANWACGIPFTLSRRTSFQRIFVVNGSSVSGNIDLGVYDWNRNKIQSTGSTARTATNIQAISFSLTLGPGRYYMAIALDSTSNVYRLSPTGDDFGFIAGETIWGSSQFPLPSAFTINQFPTGIPLMGLTKGTVV